MKSDRLTDSAPRLRPAAGKSKYAGTRSCPALLFAPLSFYGQQVLIQ